MNNATPDTGHHCRCRSGCTTRRCSCLKAGRSCSSTCACTNCANPLNGIDVDSLSICAIQNIRTVKGLSEAALAELVPLPCGDRSVPLSRMADSPIKMETHGVTSVSSEGHTTFRTRDTRRGTTRSSRARSKTWWGVGSRKVATSKLPPTLISGCTRKSWTSSSRSTPTATSWW
ncbi:MAG: hypothetical protein GY722_13270 [bacterium]|nr:hypothetical protein [bacterium]